MSVQHHRSPHRTVRRALAAVGACAALAVGCSSSSGRVGPQDPSPSGAAATACRALRAELPERLDGQRRVTPEPATKYTALWGDPPIELRCGVRRPEKLTPGSEHYNPTSDAAEVNGVSWLVEEEDGGYRFTTTDRTAHVELTVPDDYAPEVGPLTELADAVRKTLPRRDP
ncbi:DUF3515 domain-containing protein [Streptomyces sp. AJS327]|uniref:DUF3515 domain-containing protein n=1 Tax=Streptomyces sp. AJS327 TaxID=2545265 RepID=UPI0015DED1FF|nr:DUF3515 domain-containing protein [Streptomyces sp. AJS327]MBA0051780.1 DUF3515 domain-containing protein [Streptomyces sp. AJS327]